MPKKRTPRIKNIVFCKYNPDKEQYSIIINCKNIVKPYILCKNGKRCVARKYWKNKGN